jgi:hypothetical protein
MAATPLKNGYVHVRQSEHRAGARRQVRSYVVPALQRLFSSGMSSTTKDRMHYYWLYSCKMKHIFHMISSTWVLAFFSRQLESTGSNPILGIRTH